jgi:hypothetical protein
MKKIIQNQFFLILLINKILYNAFSYLFYLYSSKYVKSNYRKKYNVLRFITPNQYDITRSDCILLDQQTRVHRCLKRKTSKLVHLFIG